MKKRILCLWLPELNAADQSQAALSLESLAVWCERFSPLVAIEESATPECLLLDITGLAHLFGSEASLAERILRQFERRRIVVRAAIADTPGAASAVARWGKVADGLDTQIVSPNKTLAALRPLPVTALRLSEKTVDWLRQLGIHRIGQLEQLPREELSSRFGPELLWRWDQAMGRLAETVVPYTRPPEFQAEWSPEHPTPRQDTIEAAVKELLAKLAEQLQSSGRGVMRLECRLQCEGGASVDVAVGLFEPTVVVEHLFQLVQLRLESVRLPGPVCEIHVAAPSTAGLPCRQQELFPLGEEPARQQRHLAGLVDRLSNRLGQRAVLGVRLVPDAQPELAWRCDPLVGGKRRRRSRAMPADLPPCPLRLFPRPLALNIQQDDPPPCFRVSSEAHQVAHRWGPQRIETGWWRGRTVGRDYYRVETTTGRRFWLFRRLRDGRWFLHGAFD